MLKFADTTPVVSPVAGFRTTWELASGEAGTVGSSYHWTGNRKVGEGQMTIADIEPNSSVKVDLKFIKPVQIRERDRSAGLAKGLATLKQISEA